jgi:hypothetical protein
MLILSNKLSTFCMCSFSLFCSAGTPTLRVPEFYVAALSDWCPQWRRTVHTTHVQSKFQNNIPILKWIIWGQEWRQCGVVPYPWLWLHIEPGTLKQYLSLCSTCNWSGWGPEIHRLSKLYYAAGLRTTCVLKRAGGLSLIPYRSPISHHSPLAPIKSGNWIR